MANTENSIKNRKNKHLSPFEHGEMSALHQCGHSNREIARRLGCVHQTIGNEVYTGYFPETGRTVYEQNRKNSGAKNNLLVALEFIDYARKG